MKTLENILQSMRSRCERLKDDMARSKETRHSVRLVAAVVALDGLNDAELLRLAAELAEDVPDTLPAPFPVELRDGLQRTLAAHLAARLEGEPGSDEPLTAVEPTREPACEGRR